MTRCLAPTAHTNVNYQCDKLVTDDRHQFIILTVHLPVSWQHLRRSTWQLCVCSSSRDMIGAHHNLNSSRDLDTAVDVEGGLPTSPVHSTLHQTLTHFAQSSKIGTVTKGFDARLVNSKQPFFSFCLSGTLALKVECQSGRKSKTKNVRLASPASNPWIIV